MSFKHGISEGLKSKKNKQKKFGLPKTERLGGKAKIKRLFSKGRRFSRDNLTIIYLPKKEQNAGFVASKKIGGVVKRNRVKRILREAYRMNKAIFKGLEVVFYAQGPLNPDKVVHILASFKDGR